MEPIKITDKVYWVGAKDPDLKIFDIVMITNYGTTYNSYLIMGEKIALIDMVKDKYGNAYLEGIRKLVDPKQIDYIIINHSEPDHSGSLGSFLQEASNAQVVASKAGAIYLKEITNANLSIKTVVDGDYIDLGGKTLRFITAPFLHWPDSIFTYLEEDHILFSGDVFGSHYCHSSMFNDEIKGDFIDARKYYFDVIMGPFSKYVLDAVEKIKGMDIRIIGPSHGPIIRTAAHSYIDQFGKWARDEVEKSTDNDILICYVSAYGNTKRVAETFSEVFKKNNLKSRVYDISEEDHDKLRAEILSSKLILIGSPTINKDSVKPVWDLLSTLCPIRSRGKLFGTFGSYGWSGEAPDLVGERLTGLGLKAIDTSFKFKFVPSQEDLERAKEFAQKIIKDLDKA